MENIINQSDTLQMLKDSFKGQVTNRHTEYDNLPRAHRTPSKKDPPGQHCIYIPPGDFRKENYRVATFTHFANDQISIFILAESGFYYTGYKDRTKCFSCGSSVEDWGAGDSPYDPSLHEIDCAIIHRQETLNIPSDISQFRNLLRQLTSHSAVSTVNRQIATASQRNPPRQTPTSQNYAMSASRAPPRLSMNQSVSGLKMAQVSDPQHKDALQRLNLQKEGDRRKSFAKWPTYPAPYLPRALAQDGFFYLGNLDRVQCFSCSGVLRNWAPHDDVKQQHQIHFPTCRFHNQTETRNIAMSEEERMLADNEENQTLSLLLPTGDVSEPADPSPEEQRYLEEHLPCAAPMNPQMSEFSTRVETFRRWPMDKTKATPEQLAKAGMFYLGNSDKTKCFYCNGGLQNWDYNDEPWTEHAKWFPGCEFVNRRKGTRFVRQLAAAHPNLNKPSIRNGISLTDIPDFQNSIPRESTSNGEHHEVATTNTQTNVQAQECGHNAVEKRQDNHSKSLPAGAMSSNNLEPSLANSLQEMQDTMTCKTCKSRKSDTVFMPCGHVVSCSECASKAKRCISCKTTIKECIKIYRA